ncbi:MAG: NAD-dependent epimerase/dehydratase family protein [Deltaproteobacteria bacterium]|nr:NAD-dependent epimerase/dehydratase family protein [Deltaproteobacteria bacterium]
MKSAPLFLVTGGAGFIGSHLTDLLINEGYRVRVLDDLSTGLAENLNPEAEFVNCDVGDEAGVMDALKGVDTVFHLAARVSIRHSVDSFADDAKTNIMGSLNVFRAASLGRARRVILASSMAVYADEEHGGNVDEGHPAEPLSPYGLGKLTAERYLFMLAKTLGVEPVVLRLFNTYGTRQGFTPYVGAATIFITNALLSKPSPIFGDGLQRRDFVHVSDVARAFLLAAQKNEAAGRILNVGTGVGTTVNELAALVRKTLGRGDFIPAPAQGSELKNSVADIGAARKVLGYEPQKELSESLFEVVEYIRKERVSEAFSA